MNRARSITEQDRTERERTLTNESNTSDKARPRSLSGSADKRVDRPSLKKQALVEAHTASEDTAPEKRVVLIGKGHDLTPHPQCFF